MPPRNTDKNKEVLKDLEKTISPVLVVNNSSLKPYVELFEYEPENIYQQPLGSLVGFFEIKEYSEESAYVVNFLTSVLKKEYYINPKRQVTESLDSALHKVNLALSELAKNGNVEWLGKINAAICVLEKNNTHFSVAGNAKIFLYRNKALSEISIDLAADSIDPHPLKTFVNVSSGRLEKNDRILITSEDIFHILSVTEIKKNCQRFQDEKFVQFLKTALSNQLEMIASIVIDISEAAPKIKTKRSNIKKSDGELNAFSQSTFNNSSNPKNTFSEEAEDNNEVAVENEPTINYTDKKTGHIYIQGESREDSEGASAKISLFLDVLKEKFHQGTYFTKNEIRKHYSLYKKQLAKKRDLRLKEKDELARQKAETAELFEKQRVIEEAENAKRFAQEQELEKIRLEQEKIAQEKLIQEQAKADKLQQEMIAEQLETEKVIQKESAKPELSFMEKLELARIEQQRNSVVDLRPKEITVEIEIPIIHKEELPSETKTTGSPLFTKLPKTSLSTQNILAHISKIKQYAIPQIKEILFKFKSKKKNASNKETRNSDIVPHFSKIKNLFSQFNHKQKLYTLSAFALIFIVPIFIVHFLNKPKAPTISELQTSSPVPTEKILTNDKNIRLNASVTSIYSSTEISSLLFANDNPTIVTKNSVIVFQNNQAKEFSLPAESEKPIRATYMKDLSLVLILTSGGKVVSFSPISTKFTENKIDLANISPESFVGTYLTYLYVLDSKTNQIYRYPRADGGFGDKTNWLKDTNSLANVSGMTIDDSIYAIQNNQVLKFFKGKEVDFKLENSSTPIHFDAIYTTPDLQNLYALDQENGRVVQYSKDGSLVAQFQNETLRDGISLSVDETNKIAYITTSQGLVSVSLQ